ncbi:MAG: ABC transporter permease [Spirosomaceae bacterium]|nr:ABC transporter permease [Spirosomataceae bacterium]
MKNILLVLKREYLVRVTKKSFIVLSLLMPILIVGIYSLVIYMTVSSIEQKRVSVIDKTNLFREKFKDSKFAKYEFINTSLDSAKSRVLKKQADLIVYIPENIIEEPSTMKIYSEKTVGDVKNKIESIVQNKIRDIKLEKAGIKQEVLEDANVNVNAESVNITETGEEKKGSEGAAMIVGMICVILMFSTVLGFGMQVMRGVIEEKTNRIIEVIISSVKPFELMMGKILGVGAVGLTQFALWIFLTLAISTVAPSLMPRQQMTEMVKEQVQTQAGDKAKVDAKKIEKSAGSIVTRLLEQIKSMNLGLIIGCFLFYFFCGYIFYASIYAAIGSAVDNETDTQQFMFPVMIPLMASYLFSVMAVQFGADSSIAFWASMVPFSSPIVMMVRVTMGGVPAWEIALSMALLIGGIIFMVWLAARIYRVGILMYGKKPSWKEIWKWMTYKG